MSFSAPSMNINVRVSRFELSPKQEPRDYKVGFVVTHTHNKTSRYFEGVVPISSVDNRLNEEEIAVIAWQSIRHHVAIWHRNNKGIVGYTFEIPQEDFEKMIDLGKESGLYSSNNLYHYLGRPTSSLTGSNILERGGLPNDLFTEKRQLY